MFHSLALRTVGKYLAHKYKTLFTLIIKRARTRTLKSCQKKIRQNQAHEFSTEVTTCG